MTVGFEKVNTVTTNLEAHVKRLESEVCYLRSEVRNETKKRGKTEKEKEKEEEEEDTRLEQEQQEDNEGFVGDHGTDMDFYHEGITGYEQQEDVVEVQNPETEEEKQAEETNGENEEEETNGENNEEETYGEEEESKEKEIIVKKQKTPKPKREKKESKFKKTPYRTGVNNAVAQKRKSTLAGTSKNNNKKPKK